MKPSESSDAQGYVEAALQLLKGQTSPKKVLFLITTLNQQSHVQATIKEVNKAQGQVGNLLFAPKEQDFKTYIMVAGPGHYCRNLEEVLEVAAILVFPNYHDLARAISDREDILGVTFTSFPSNLASTGHSLLLRVRLTNNSETKAVQRGTVVHIYGFLHYEGYDLTTEEIPPGGSWDTHLKLKYRTENPQSMDHFSGWIGYLVESADGEQHGTTFLCTGA
jgi:hypothetical protein